MTDLFAALESLTVPNVRTTRQRASTGGLRERDAKAYIRDLFIRNGMPSSLADWAYGVLVEGASGTEMVQRMYQRPEFRDRFQALFRYQELNPNAPAISPAQVLAFEREAAERMRAAGFPPQFYDHWTDFVDWIGSGKSMVELAERIDEAFVRVATAPTAVREKFAEFFGPSGDAALAALVLDATKALPVLRIQVRAAEVAGAGFNFGFTLDRNRSMEIARGGFDYGSAQDRFANLVRSTPLFQEIVGETEDMTPTEEGVEAVFGLEGAGQALEAIERRREQRVAATSGGGGVQGSEITGARGLGSAS